MSSTYSTLKFELIGTGEQQGLWGQTANTNLGTAVEQALVGMATLLAADFPSNIGTLVLANTNAAQNARALCLTIDSGALTSAGTLNVPAIQKPYVVINNASHAITVKVTGQTGVTIPSGKRSIVYNNGVDVGDQVNFLSSLVLGTALPVASGGTGATTASAARTALDVPSTGGTGATGTWGINISGNAATATSATSATTATNATNATNANYATSAGSATTATTATTAGNVSGTVAVANGGTGLTATPTNGQIDIGNGSGFTRATLTAGSGISVTNGAGSITIAATGGGGNVTGPGSSTNYAIATYNGTAGTTLRNQSNWTIDAANTLYGGSSSQISLGSSSTFAMGSSSTVSLSSSSNIAMGTGSWMYVDGNTTTYSNRFKFVSPSTSPVNETGISVCPPATDGAAAISATKDPNITNTSFTGLIHSNIDGRLECGRLGSGTYLPFSIITSGAARMTFLTTGHVTPGADGTQNFGASSYRWATIYATTGTINTSDARLKTAVRQFTNAEIAASKDMSKEIGVYKWLDAVQAKGADARSHIGLTVQRAIEIMQEHGLDPMAYGFICYDKWDASEKKSPAIYDQPEKTEVIPAGDRYSFRYDELSMFLARGFEARLAALEAV